MNAFSLYGILTFLLWRHITAKWARILLILFSMMMILSIGISRIYLGVHYPSDIIAGYLAGGFWIAISIWFFQRYQERRKKKIFNKGSRLLQDKQPAGNKSAVDSNQLGA